MSTNEKILLELLLDARIKNARLEKLFDEMDKSLEDFGANNVDVWEESGHYRHLWHKLQDYTYVVHDIMLGND